MKLLSKLTLFITLSKLAVVALFVFLLPYIVDSIAFKYTNYYLREQKKKVLNIIAKNGVDYYMQGQGNYGSYTMLKEEYIALEPVTQQAYTDTIETAQRIVEQDTLTYRILTHTFSSNRKNYLLEIGKTTEAINQYTRPLQRVALNVLIVLTLFTMVIDLIYTRFLLRPLGRIIKTKLVNRKFPFNEHIPPVNTTTTDFKYLDNSLIQLMDQIHIAFEKEREFTSNASHELMTPISILQNKMENMLIDQDISEQQQQKMADMMKTLNRLKKIVHSLLLISRIENDQFAKADNINPRAMIDEVMEELGHRLEEKEINFKTDLKDGVILESMNHDLLFQLFYNLIHNAIRYNNVKGSIVITDDFIRGESYSIHIHDTGIGIPPEETGNIFNRFKKANRHNGEGYGLGLAIVKSIADYHSLKLVVNSQLNKGTSFRLIFPL